MKKFLNRVSNRIVFRYIVAFFFLSSRVPPSFHVPRVYLPMETRALNEKGRREREREKRERQSDIERERERRKREEEVPIPVSKGRRSRAELRSEGCAGAFHHHPWGRRSRSGATKTEEEGRLVERTHPEMQSRSVGVNRVASQQSSKSTRSRATKPPRISSFVDLHFPRCVRVPHVALAAFLLVGVHRHEIRKARSRTTTLEEN